jgi:alkylhydroperoxidase family enzyme
MRIEPLQEPFDAGTADVLRSMMPPGVPPIALFRTFARNPAMTAAMRGWGGYCLSREFSVDMRAREIVIDRVCARCGCDYEFGVHMAFFADRAGLTSEQMRSLASGTADDPCWIEGRDRALVRFVDELHDTATVSGDLWGELSASFRPAQLLDLLMLAGWYHAISFVARAAGVPLEPGAPTLAAAG